MNRTTLKSQLRAYLGTTADDPAFPDATLEPILQQAYDSLVATIHLANPAYLSKTVTLTPDSATSHLYTFTTQTPAIADFSRWLEVRYTDEDGEQLEECRLEEMRGAGADFFTMTGPDESVVLQTSKDSTAGSNLYFRYAYQPAAFASDSDTPAGIPAKFHDVVALEALFAYGLGGEQRLPPELFARWTDRKAQMLASVGRRGTQPSRTRILDEVDL